MTLRFIRWILPFFFVGFGMGAARPPARTLRPDVPYRSVPGGGPDRGSRCALDLYLPAAPKGCPSLLWLHGGGLTGGTRKSPVSRRVGEYFAAHGVAVAMADYRLSPAVGFPAYVEDAAAAFAWLKANIAAAGGDPAKVFVGGHSAGAYLALMAGLDDRYLRGERLEAAAIAGVVAISGQAVTHFTIRAERRLGDQLVVDDAAPLRHVAARPFPFMLLFAGHDMVLRVEENRLLGAALREAGCTVEERFYEDRDHGSIVARIGMGADVVAEDILHFIEGRAQAIGK